MRSRHHSVQGMDGRAAGKLEIPHRARFSRFIVMSAKGRCFLRTSARPAAMLEPPCWDAPSAWVFLRPRT